MTINLVARGVGVVIALGFMTLSALINWRYGSTLARPPTDQLIMASASLLVDVAKATTPFFVVLAVRLRRWPQALVAALFWLVCTCQSLSFLVGYSELHRAVATGDLAARKLEHRTLVEVLQRRRAERDVLGTVVAATVTAAKIERMKQDRRWTSSRECVFRSDAGARQFCSELRGSEERLRIGLEASRLDEEIRRLVAEIASRSVAEARGDGDPRAGVVARLLGVTTQAADLILLITFLSVIEIGSGLGLFLALVETRSASKPATARDGKGQRGSAEPGASDHAMAQDVAETSLPTRRSAGVERAGDVAKFARFRLVAAPGEALSLSTLREAYLAWCRGECLGAKAPGEFTIEFAELADHVGIRSTGTRDRPMYMDVRLND